ncbi:hypothetical protein THRCLA_01232 [Thraustotheca clavata]|uniref:Alkylated DNA repair protein alkB homolog 8 n=1 Tax=Thraustotheca clavata TaxID=74557 RepID=A0A1W0A934_9STRA|nr:hypothetical protein THRCLA_01232 [Thraustotheca clavata]
MPNFCKNIAETMHALRPDLDLPDQCTINEYIPGQGIAPHVDTADVFTEYIASLSLGSDIVMDFRLASNPSIVKHVHLKRGSLCLMVAEARYHWKHGIAYRKHDRIAGKITSRSRRVSMTFRKVLNERNSSRMNQSVQKPSEIEMEHVHGVYDSIASHFSHTRHHPWPLVADFLNGLPSGSMVADIGCGNGKYLGVNSDLMMIGSDRSIPLLTVCSQRSHEVFGCDGLAVPLRTGAFDAAICIAVLHHMSTIEHRLQILRELSRIVKVGGQIYIVAWAFEQDERSKRKFETQDVMVEWKLQQKYIDTREPLPNHVQLDKEKKWAIYQRYCHVYRDLELEMLVRQIPGLTVTKVEMMRTAPMSSLDDIFGDCNEFLASTSAAPSSSFSLEGLGLDDLGLGELKPSGDVLSPTTAAITSDPSDFLSWLDAKPTSPVGNEPKLDGPASESFNFDSPLTVPAKASVDTTFVLDDEPKEDKEIPATPVPPVDKRVENEFAVPPPAPQVKEIQVEANSTGNPFLNPAPAAKTNSKPATPISSVRKEEPKPLTPTSSFSMSPPAPGGDKTTPPPTNIDGDKTAPFQSNRSVPPAIETKEESRGSSFENAKSPANLPTYSSQDGTKVIANDELRAHYRALNKIPIEERLQAWCTLLEAPLLETKSIELGSSEQIRRDAEAVCSLLFADGVFCKGLEKDGVSPDTARLSLTDQVEALILNECEKHTIAYTPGLALAFAPLIFLGGADPLRSDLFGIMNMITVRMFPHLIAHVPMSHVALARRPLLKLLLLYHDPTIALHLDHTFPSWSEPGLIPDQWLASLLEGTDHTTAIGLEVASRVWDCCVVNASSTYPAIIMIFVLLAAILGSKKRLLSLTNGPNLRSCMLQLFVETMSRHQTLIANVHELIEKTPFSFCTKLCDAGMETQTSSPVEESRSGSFTRTGSSSSVVSPKPRTASKESLEVKTTSKFSLGQLSSINTKILAQASHLKSSITGKAEDSRSDSFHLETPCTYFSMTISACEVIPSVFRSFKSSCTEKIRYFIVDCRPQESLALGRIPTSFHFNSESLLDPAAFDTVMATLEPMKSSVHICIMGHGHSRYASSMVKDLNYNKSDVADMIAKDAAQINDTVMFLTKKGFPYVSIIDGGYASAHRYLAKSRLFTLSDLCDHDPNNCNLCHHGQTLKAKGRTSSTASLMSDEENEHIQRSEGGVCLGRFGPDGRVRSKPTTPSEVTSPSSYFSSMTTALKDGGKTLTAVSGKTLNAVPGSALMSGAFKDSKNWMMKKKDSIDIGGKLSDAKAHLHLNEINMPSMTSVRSAVDAAVKRDSTLNPANMLKKAASSFAATMGPMEPAATMGNSTSGVHSPPIATSPGAKKPAVKPASEAVFSIDDDDEDEVDRALNSTDGGYDEAEAPAVEHIVEKGQIQLLKKGMQIHMHQLLPLVSSPLFSCYKKKIRNGGSTLVPRYIVIAEGHIIVLRPDKGQEDASSVRSCHHLSHVARMTCMKKNALMVTMYYKFDGKEKQNSYEVQQRDAFIKVVRSSMEELAAQQRQREE